MLGAIFLSQLTLATEISPIRQYQPEQLDSVVTTYKPENNARDMEHLDRTDVEEIFLIVSIEEKINLAELKAYSIQRNSEIRKILMVN